MGSIAHARISTLTTPSERIELESNCAHIVPWASPPPPPEPQDLSRAYGPDGAAGGLSRSTPRRADDATTRLRERADTSVRRAGLGARLLATSDEARARWYIADYSAFLFSVQITVQAVGISNYPGRSSTSFSGKYVTFESVIKEAVASLRVPPLPTFRVRYTLVRQ